MGCLNKTSFGVIIASIVLCALMPVYAAPMTDGQSINGVTYDMPWYEIKNVAGDATIFLIDKDGDMYLDADAIAVSSAITGPFANSLIIQDAGDEIFVINATNAYFSGKVYPNFATLPTMDGDDMVIQNVAGTPVAIFDGDDNSLYLSGNATHDAVTVEPRNALEFTGATRVAGSYPAGTHEYVVLPSMAIDFSAGMTFEGWFYFDALQNWAHPVSISDGTNSFQILHHATNATLRFNTVNSTSSEWISATDIIDLNEWIHIAYTVTPTGGGVATGRLYKNGLLIDTDAGQRSFPNTTWTTGRFAWGSASDGNMSFDGKLDEFRFWNDVRSESELQSNMTKTYGGIADKTGLVAYWDFNDVLGSKLIDSHSSNFHGTLQDMNSDAWVGSYTERTLTIASAGNGTLSPTGAQTVADGQSFPIVATPSANYTFEYWAKTAGAGTVTFSDAANDTTWVTVTGGDATITAYFDYTTWANTTTYTLNTTATYANVTSTLTDFPILVRLTTGDFTFADARGNGEDIRFATAAGVPMAYEIERWDSTNALAEIWVNVPSIAGNNTTDIKMYWGRAEVLARSDGEAVFPLADSYEGVWHLNDITDLDDATANAGTGTNSGTVNIAGNIGQAVDYEGADWISLPAANFSDLTTQVSVSCWIYGDAAMQPQNNLLFRGSDVSGNNALAAYVPWSDQNVFWDAGNVGVLLNRLYGAVDASKWEGAWVYYTFTKDQTTGALEIFINGNSEMSGTGYTYTFSTIVTFLLGAYTTGLYNYDGIIDEFRVSSTVRSDDWVKLSFENQRSENYLINQRPQLTITAGSNGSVDNPGINQVVNPMALHAIPDAGYTFNGWSRPTNPGNLTIADSALLTTTVTATESGEVQANFVTKPSNALHFTGATNVAGSYPAGTHEYVDLPDINFQATGTYSVEAWIYWDALKNWSRPLYFREASATNDGFVIYADGTGTTLRFSVCDGGGTCTVLPISSYITLDTWTHVAMSATSGGDITIYKNGVVAGSGTAPSFSGAGATQYNLFGSGAGNAGDESFDGYLDDVRIWTDIRSQVEIQNDMFNLYGSYIASDNLLAHWDFNHVMGDTLYESTGNYDGVLTDMGHDDWVSSFTTNALTMTAGSNGTVLPTGTLNIATGHSGYITGTPNTGYTFNGWSETTNPGNITLGSASDFRTTATLIGDGEVTANFTTEPENTLVFDGVNEYVDLPDINVDWSSGLTFEAWVYMDAQKAQIPVIFHMSNNGSQNFNVGGSANSDNLRVASNEASFKDVNYGGFFTLDDWTHIAVTVASDGSTIVYKNGGQVTTGTLDIATSVNRSDVFIGYNIYTEYFFDGKVDEVRLWNDVRTAGEVYQNQYESYENLSNSDNLIASWDFNQSLGEAVRDKEGGYHGTMTNMESGDWQTSWTRRTLTINNGGNGTTWPSGAKTAMDNRNYYISATPSANYYFNNWTDGGGAATATFTASGTTPSYAKITGGDGIIQANFVADVTAPSVPTNLTTSGHADGGFYLNWGASTDALSGVAGYRIYRNGTLLNTVTSGTSKWIARGGKRSYTIASYDNEGNESAKSRVLYHLEVEARDNSYDINFGYGNYAGDLDDNSGAAPDWLEWNSIVFSGGTYRVSMRKSSNDATYRHELNIQLDGVTYANIYRHESDGGWTNWEVASDNNTITVPTGTRKVSAVFNGINWNVDWVQILPE